MSAAPTKPAPRPLVRPTQQAWRAQLRHAIRSPDQLIERLGLSSELLDDAYAGHRDFPVLVPESYLERIQPGRADDPLLRQVLPTRQESEPQPAGFAADPLAEKNHSGGPAILHKYSHRSLLLTTGACASHCRYCFRRAYSRSQSGSWRKALRYWQDHGAPEEVILSGGDPLMLDDQALDELIRGLAALPGVQRLRLHSRIPVVLPHRVTEDLGDLLAASPLQTVCVIHANHPQEIDGAVLEGLARLRPSFTALLNQAVLLRGVNDDASVLAELSTRLFAAGVLPYYLHLLDRVSGAAHFAVEAQRGQALIAELSTRLPGYLVPRLAREVPGAPAKSLL